MRFSHRAYAGRGATAAVWRCSACGTLAQDTAAAPVAQARSPRRQRQPIDEGPPPNPVIDPALAARLLGETPAPD